MEKQKVEEVPAGTKEEEEEVEYKNKVVFLRKSKAGKHLFIFDSREDLIPGGTLIFDISEVERVIESSTEWVKVSMLPPKGEDNVRKMPPKSDAGTKE